MVGIDIDERTGTGEEGDVDADRNGGRGKMISLFEKRGIQKWWEDLWRGWWDSFI